MTCMKYAPKTGTKRRHDLGKRQRGQLSVGKVAFLCPETLERYRQCPSIAQLSHTELHRTALPISLSSVTPLFTSCQSSPLIVLEIP